MNAIMKNHWKDFYNAIDDVVDHWKVCGITASRPQKILSGLVIQNCGNIASKNGGNVEINDRKILVPSGSRQQNSTK